MTKIKVLTESGCIISELVNPKPVQIIDEINGVTFDESEEKQTMPNIYYGFNTFVEIKDKISSELAIRLIALESSGAIARKDATYTANSRVLATGYSIPDQNPVNYRQISDFWLSKAGKDPLKVFKDPIKVFVDDKTTGADDKTTGADDKTTGAEKAE